MTIVSDLPKTDNKEEIYLQVFKQVEALLDGERDLIANMANISSVVHHAFNFWWTGFYLVRKNELVLGPFQGPVACTRISKGKGVCGKAWETKSIQIVPDVHEFEGHIACSSETNSEIVIPINIVFFIVIVVSIFAIR